MKTERNYSLYYLKHPIEREIRYVGITNDPERRFRDHRKSSKYDKHSHLPIYCWWRKLAKQGLEPAMEILKTGLTKEEAEQAEIETIALYRKYSNRMLNVSDGGNLSRAGVPHSEETKKKISEASKDRTHSEETKRKLSKANKGKTPSEETRKKLSESLKGRTHSEETKRKLSKANKGRTLSKETKRKISKAVKSRISSEVRKKICEANKGKTHSEETKKKISESLKGRRAKTYTFLYNGNKVVIHGLSQFCKDNNLDWSTMHKVLNGKRKSYKGWIAANRGEK